MKDTPKAPQRLEYGVIQKYGNGSTLWFEPITDILDGFVLRESDSDGILAVFGQSSFPAWSMEQQD